MCGLAPRARARAPNESVFGGMFGARAARVCANKTPCNSNNNNNNNNINNINNINNNNNNELTLSSPALPVGALALE